METRFLHESEARASSWVLPVLPVAREMTFADAPHQGGTFSHGQGLKTPIFTATPRSIARDRFPDLKPLDHKWAFDRCVQTIKPDFPLAIAIANEPPAVR
jgi:hypothetical protein